MRISTLTIAIAAVAGLAAAPAAARSTITLYSAPNYQGHAITLDHAVRDLDNHDWDFGDRAQSARVRGRWQVCAAKNFQGDCIILNHDAPRLKDYDMNRRADSLRPL
ncbi:MAG: beta/gamma crystallin-related protein [Rhizomicrobium sp.]